MKLEEISPFRISLTVSEHVQDVLKKLILNFKDPKKAHRILSKKMGIHEKTFLRLLKLKNKPTASTVLKIYKTYLNQFNDADVILLMPPEVVNFLKRTKILNCSQKTEAGLNEKVDQEIRSNSLFAEIYVLAGTGPIHFDEVKIRYGLFGIELIKQMLEKKIIKEVHQQVYILGENQASFAEDTLLNTGLLLAKNFTHIDYGPKRDQNFISFFAEGLSQEAYLEWIKIDREACRKKRELAQNPKNLGSIRAFSFQVIETLEIKVKN